MALASVEENEKVETEEGGEESQKKKKKRRKNKKKKKKGPKQEGADTATGTPGTMGGRDDV